LLPYFQESAVLIDVCCLVCTFLEGGHGEGVEEGTYGFASVISSCMAGPQASITGMQHGAPLDRVSAEDGFELERKKGVSQEKRRMDEVNGPCYIGLTGACNTTHKGSSRLSGQRDGAPVIGGLTMRNASTASVFLKKRERE
jgi:hypothetical protein